MNKINIIRIYYKAYVLCEDSITIGLLFYDETNKKCTYELTKNWNRVKVFGDITSDDILNIKNYFSFETTKIKRDIYNNKFNLNNFLLDRNLTKNKYVPYLYFDEDIDSIYTNKNIYDFSKEYVERIKFK